MSHSSILHAVREITVADRLLGAQKRVLEQAIAGSSLDALLKLIAQAAADHTRGRAVIFLVSTGGDKLRFAASAGLPASYKHEFDGFSIDPKTPSCAYSGERVVIEDVAKNPFWAPFLGLAREHDIRASWATPIRTFGGRVLGTLAVYHRVAKMPEPDDLEGIDLLAHTASLLIAREQVDRERLEALAEGQRSALMAREMSHRIMNNFQILLGLLKMQSRSSGDEPMQTVVEGLSNRLQAMAVTHRALVELHAHTDGNVSASDYLHALVDALASGISDRQRCVMKVEVDPQLKIRADILASVGLIVTELVTNATKHAFTDMEACVIEVALHRSEEGHSLSISDNGHGMPQGTARSSGTGLGMTIVRSLTEQIGGALRVENLAPGTRFVVTFK